MRTVRALLSLAAIAAVAVGVGVVVGDIWDARRGNGAALIVMGVAVWALIIEATRPTT